MKKLNLKGKPLLVAGVYDCLSALLAKKAGFKTLYLSGGGLSVSLLGKPDIGLLKLDELVFMTKRIAQAARLPLLVDADTGYGHVARTVRALEKAGAAGVQIEDQTFPKRCGHLAGKSVVPTQTMVKKIRQARVARRQKSFLIIARTDARGVLGLREAQNRAETYKKAGADLIFPEALRTKAEFKAFGAKKRLGTLMANMTEFGVSPLLKASELKKLGFQLILYPMTGFRSAAQAMGKALTLIKKSGNNKGVIKNLQTRQALYDLIGYAGKTNLKK